MVLEMQFPDGLLVLQVILRCFVSILCAKIGPKLYVAL